MEKRDEFKEPHEFVKKPPVDLKALQRRQDKIREELLEPVEEKMIQPRSRKVDTQGMPNYDRECLRQFSSADENLNRHVLGNIPLKLVDFRTSKYYQMLTVKNPDNKQQYYEQMFDKLRVMFEVAYLPEDFEKIKMHNLNSDQLLCLMQSQNFIENANPCRHIDCLKAIQKARQVKSYTSHPEVTALVTRLATEQDILCNLPESYVTALAHACSKMKIDDEVVWFSLAEHLAKQSDFFNVRDLSTFIYAMTNVSKFKPVILNFDNLYRKLEIQFIKKFEADERKVKGQDLAITMTSYSKSQNGSVQFWKAMEGIVIANSKKLNGQELSNIIYSYYKAENSETMEIFLQLKPRVIELMPKLKPVELCQILMAYTECDEDSQLMDDSLIAQFEMEFKGRYEAMNPIDSSTYYYCFTKLGFRGDGLFYKYVQKCVTKTIRSFEGPHLKHMFYRFDDLENMRLNRGVRGRLVEHLRWLMREKQLKGYDANLIYMHTKQLPYEPTVRHDYTVESPTLGQSVTPVLPDYKYADIHIELRNYLERIRYFK